MTGFFGRSVKDINNPVNGVFFVVFSKILRPI